MRGMGQGIRGLCKQLTRARTTSAAGWVVAWLLLCAPAVAQEQPPACCAHFDFVLERTVFKVAVVDLKLSVDESTGARVGELLSQDLEKDQFAAAAAALYLDSRHADVVMTFLRSITMGQFLDGAEETLEELAEANHLDAESVARIAGENEERFAFLGEDGIQEGDRLLYTLRGDTVRTRYVTAHGSERLSDVRIGPERRIALLGSYFGLGTNFRDGLLDSILALRSER